MVQNDQLHHLTVRNLSPQIKWEALQNTGPGTSGFNPSSTQNSFVQKITASLPFGYGYPSGGGSKVTMYSVQAIYSKVNGVWMLKSMYPNP